MEEQRITAADVKADIRTRKQIKRIVYIILAVVAVIVMSVGQMSQNPSVPSWSGITDNIISDSDGLLADSVLMQVHVIDVGQGDCTLIIAGDTTVLIDAGERYYDDEVIEYLDRLKIKTLDYVVMTHPHTDHFGGLIKILSSYNAEKLIMPEVEDSLVPTNTTYSDFLDAAIAARDNGTSIIAADAGQSYALDNGVKMTVLSPVRGSYYSNLNDYSVALLFECDEITLFTAGDISTVVEEEIHKNYPEIRADLMKVSHHGSSASNSEEFLKQLSPDYAYICCGVDNSYGHPSFGTIARLKQFGIEYKRTDLDGSFTWYTDGKTISDKEN